MDDNSQRQRLTGVTKVDSNATVLNDASNVNANNDTVSPIASIAPTSLPDSTVDTTTTQSADVSLASRLGTESTPGATPGIVATTTTPIPANPDPSAETTSSDVVNADEIATVPTSETPGITVTDNMITNTPTNAPSTSESLVTTETVTTETSTSADIEMTSSTESDNARLIEAVNVNSTTELASSTTQMVNTDVPVTTISQGLRSDIPDTMTFSSIVDSTTTTQVPSEIAIPSAISENIEANTIQQSDDMTTPRATDAPINAMSDGVEMSTTQQPGVTSSQTTEIIMDGEIEDIETNTVQQYDSTSQTTETTSTFEPPTTQENSEDVIVIQATHTPFAGFTSRTRLIDFAQDILLRLQANRTTTATPVQQSIATTTSPIPPNAISDSPLANINSQTITEETTTVQPGLRDVDTTTLSLLNAEATTDRDVDSTTQTTTSITNESQETTTQNTINLEIAQDMINSSAVSEQRLSSTVDERNAMSLDLESTTTGSTMDAEVTTAATAMSLPRDFVTENAPSSSNDTLLTELMTIAKSLFSEAMNETRQSPTSNQVSDIEMTTVPETNNSIRANDTIENDETNRFASPNNATSMSSELPASLESTSVRVDVTTSVDSPQNETEENSSRAPVIESEISLLELNARPVAVESPVDVGDITSVMPETSISQTETQTPNVIISVTASMNFQLTTNTPDSQSPNLTQTFNNTEQQTVPSINLAQRGQVTIISNENVELVNRSLTESLMDSTTNNPLVTDPISMNTEGTLSNTNEFMTSDISKETVTESTTSVAITESNVVQTNAEDAATTNNQTPESATTESISDPQVTTDQSLITDASFLTTTLSTISDINIPAMTNADGIQSSSTEPSTETVRNPVDSTDATTNQFNDITTNVPQLTLADLMSENPNFIARFQDTTATTAQGTAGSGMIQPEQTTEITIPTITSSSALMPTNPSISPESSTIDTTTASSVEPTIATTTTIDAATTTTTTLMTTTTTTPETTSTVSSSRVDVTVGPMSETTTMTVDINENLVSTETSTDTATTRGTTTVAPTESEDLNSISRMDVGEEQTTTMTTTTTGATSTTSTSTTTATSITSNIPDRMITRPPFASFGSLNTIPFLGRFGGSQMTPAPRPTSSSRAPVRDYLIYGIYPNKTIVRKRPEDNLIDARNVDSPYVIFGIYPDGRLVRKFPNGTIIPDSPRNPVEVVFTLRTTTTTNRPAPRPYYNQANQAGTYNQYQVPVYYNNRRPELDELTRNAQSPGRVDIGLTGNAIGVAPGVGPYFAGPLGTPASVPSINKMVSLSDLFIKIVLYPLYDKSRLESIN